MQIVHVVRQFHPAVGGIESVVLELAAAQIAAGHSVRIVTLDRLFNAADARKLPARERIVGAQVVRIPFFGSSRYPIAPAVLRHLGDADIVHVHAIDFFFDFLAWTKPLHRKRLVVSTHGGFFHTHYAARLKRLYFATVTRLSLTWYDGVAAVSVADRELFGRLRRRGVVCIENGANVAKYANAGAPAPVKTIAWIGRFAANKRLDRLIAFVAALRRLDGEWTLKIAGRPWDLAASAKSSRWRRTPASRPPWRFCVAVGRRDWRLLGDLLGACEPIGLRRLRACCGGGPLGRPIPRSQRYSGLSPPGRAGWRRDAA